jgi:hypothetical protein
MCGCTATIPVTLSQSGIPATGQPQPTQILDTEPQNQQSHHTCDSSAQYRKKRAKSRQLENGIWQKEPKGACERSKLNVTEVGCQQFRVFLLKVTPSS